MKTPKEKALELRDEFYTFANGTGSNENFYESICEENAKQCALICAEEIHNAIPNENWIDEERREYWAEVKLEIKKL